MGRPGEVGFVRAAVIAGMRGEEFDVETDEELLGQMTEAAEACLTPEETNSLFGGVTRRGACRAPRAIDPDTDVSRLPATAGDDPTTGGYPLSSRAGKPSDRGRSRRPQPARRRPAAPRSGRLRTLRGDRPRPRRGPTVPVGETVGRSPHGQQGPGAPNPPRSRLLTLSRRSARRRRPNESRGSAGYPHLLSVEGDRDSAIRPYRRRGDTAHTGVGRRRRACASSSTATPPSCAALDSGCTFFAGYPITPASAIPDGDDARAAPRGWCRHPGEDEIASIGMCIGATLAGARAMTATSGPGISLYSENVGLAIMGEVPLVIVDVQRLGPSTGGATTVSQGDVQFVRWGTAGGFPIIALSPSTVPEAYALTAKAFDLAERFRCPVFLLTDKELATTLATVDLDAYPQVAVRSRATGEGGPPYRFDPVDVVTPLHEFGRGTTVRFTGSTHDEAGFITKHLPTVDALNRHLIEKIEAHRPRSRWSMPTSRTTPPRSCSATASPGCGAGGGGHRPQQRRAVLGLVLQTLWPVPETAIGAALGGVQRVIVPELNPGLYRRDRVHRRRADRDRGGTHRRRTDLSRADLGGGGMTVTISAPYRNDTPYPFCPGCGHGGILDSLDEALRSLAL